MTEQGRINVSKLIGCLFGLAAATIWFYYWMAIASPQEVASAHRKHPQVAAKVVAVGPIQGKSVDNLFRIAVLNFTDQYGRHRQVSLPMPVSEEAGFSEPLVLNQQGRYNYTDRDMRDIDDPRAGADDLAVLMVAPVVTWAALGLAVAA